MSITIEPDPLPLTAKRLLGLALLSVALVLSISLATNKRIEVERPQLAVELRPLESKVEASSIEEVIPALAPEKPAEPVQEVKQPEVVVTAPPVVQEPVKPVVKPRVVAKPAPKVTGTHAEWMAQAGIAESDWQHVEYIIGKENALWCATRWNGQRTCPDVVTETNPNPRGSSAYGVCQALPGRKMQSAGADWQTNIVTQLRWCNSYAHARYGSWAKAVSFWQVNKHW